MLSQSTKNEQKIIKDEAKEEISVTVEQINSFINVADKATRADPSGFDDYVDDHFYTEISEFIEPISTHTRKLTPLEFSNFSNLIIKYCNQNSRLAFWALALIDDVYLQNSSIMKSSHSYPHIKALYDFLWRGLYTAIKKDSPQIDAYLNMFESVLKKMNHKKFLDRYMATYKELDLPPKPPFPLDHQDKETGNTLLIFAVRQLGRYERIVKRLVENGAFVHVRDGKNFSALDIAIQYNLIHMADILLQHRRKRDPLNLKIFYAQLVMVKEPCSWLRLLEKHEIDLTKKESDGRDLMDYAIQAPSFDLIQALYERGINLPAHQVLKQFKPWDADQIKWLDFLIKIKVNLNLIRDEESTLLSCCVQNNNLSGIEKLFEAGVDMDASTVARLKKVDNSSIVKVFLNKVISSSPSFVLYKSAIFNVAINFSLQYNDVSMAKYLISLGTEIPPKDMMQQIYVGAQSAGDWIDLLLLEKNNNPDLDISTVTKHRYGDTPLIVAASEKDLDRTLKLLNASKDIHKMIDKRNRDYSALSFALKDPGNIKLVDALLFYGADIVIGNRRLIYQLASSHIRESEDPSLKYAAISCLYMLYRDKQKKQYTQKVVTKEMLASHNSFIETELFVKEKSDAPEEKTHSEDQTSLFPGEKGKKCAKIIRQYLFSTKPPRVEPPLSLEERNCVKCRV